uniref:Reprolysin n=1 Tax=Rhipicephalus appendiculatus TaxID=34631 RepID=A0A131YTM3_RHIAP
MLHKIFEVKPVIENLNAVPDYVRLMETYKLKNSNGSRQGSHFPQSRAANIDRFPVELHVISDKAHQKAYKKNEQLIIYMAVMTNAVNLRFMDMVNPKISFILVGVTRAKNHDFADSNGRDIDASKMYGGLKDYNKQGKIPGYHDVVYLATGLDMYMVVKGAKNNRILGLATEGGICAPNAVGEGEDTPHMYDGVRTMAHELAHTLGSPHDETPECPWADGYLMTNVEVGTNKHKISKCSEKKIREYVRKLSDDCIKVMNKQNYMKDQKRFPGQTIRDEYYCRKLTKQRGKKVKVIATKAPNCFLKCCYVFMGYRSCSKHEMLDGMTCGHGKTCKRGICGYH